MNDKREPMKATLLSLSDEDRASNMLMDCADFFAATLAKADPKAWKHLLIYAPKSTPSERDREIAQATLEKINRLSMFQSSKITDIIAAALAKVRAEGRAEGREEEREACAKVLESDRNYIAADIIRSRKDD